MSSGTYMQLNNVTTRSNVDLFVEKLINPDNDTIVLSYTKQQEFERVNKCLELIKVKVSRAKVIPLLIQQYKISRAEAYRIYEDTIYVFDTIYKRRQGRDVHVDILVGNIIDTYNKAVAADDLKNATYAMRLYMDAIKEFFGGYEAEQYAQLQPPSVTFIIPEHVLKIESNPDLKKRIKDSLTYKKRNADVFDEIKPTRSDNP